MNKAEVSPQRMSNKNHCMPLQSALGSAATPSLSKLACLCSIAMLAACGHLGGSENHSPDSPSATSATPMPAWAQQQGWQHQHFPSKRHTIYRADKKQGREAVRAQSDRAMSVMRKALRVEPADLGSVHFSWLTQGELSQADMAVRDGDDAVLRVVLTFEGDRSRFSLRNQMLSELAMSLTGEPLPYASLMYVWCNTRQTGEIITNPRTDRIRKLVVESGSANLGKWLDYKRDIRADYIRTFGEEPGALVGMALMTDTDNTQSKATAWYGPISFTPANRASAASPVR